MDSGAFTAIKKDGGYKDPASVYAREIKRWSSEATLLAAVSQDYMCEAHMLAITGLTILEHQRLTIQRYKELLACDRGGVYLMPVLQGYEPQDYASHIRQYGDLIFENMWIGVGSVCKRNGDPAAIERVLLAIHAVRPDIRLHGFGVKLTALGSPIVRNNLFSADSMAWSFNARFQGRNQNDWREADIYRRRVEAQTEEAPCPII